MRVVSCLVTVAWLLTLAEPCPRPAICGAQAQHQCCCDKHEQCSCQLKSHRAPAPPPVATSAEVSKDQQSLPAAETSFPLATEVTATALALPFSGPAAPSLPLYLSSGAFRC
jgi:hypothetical protein